ncbi:hypothetical protein Cgig2_029582 [Carnegiea gigantea]|uniref:Uncharacterized protein n=1 Tax=Carnegiea gigantea TaxID=171969 RepID=A0A9Q1JV94_9CARY|nr:hypothetical protein Cgig2_029582 [Carnegiea gigantea]
MSFWDLELHVFRFGTYKLCPSTKEFSTLLRFFLYYPPIAPSSSKHLSSQKYHRLLALSAKDVTSIMISEEVDFISLIAYLKKDHGYALEGLHRSRAIILCLLGAFPFTGDFDNRGPTVLLAMVDDHCHEYWLCLLLITIPTAPRSINISKFYIEWTTECNAEKRKALREKENTGASKGKEARELEEKGDSPHIEKKRIKDPPLKDNSPK